MYAVIRASHMLCALQPERVSRVIDKQVVRGKIFIYLFIYELHNVCAQLPLTRYHLHPSAKVEDRCALAEKEEEHCADGHQSYCHCHSHEDRTYAEWKVGNC